MEEYIDDDDLIVENVGRVPYFEKSSIAEKVEYTGKKRGRKGKAKRNDSYEDYKESDVITFIQKVVSKRILWDASIDNSHRREVIRTLFDRIENECFKFMPRGKNKHGDSAKKLWNELLADYNAYSKKHQKAASGSGVDCLPTFKYSSQMSFLDEAANKRKVKNTFIIGPKDQFITESDNDDKDKEDDEEIDELKENVLEELVLETPKRKRSLDEYKTPKRPRRENQVDELLKKLYESNVSIMSAVDDMKTSSSCLTERLCKTFQKQVEKWDDVDKFSAEADVIRYIRSLKPSGPANVPSNYEESLSMPRQRFVASNSPMSSGHYIPHVNFNSMQPTSSSSYSGEYPYNGYEFNNLFDI